MAEYKCGNCREILILPPKARFCPECGSSSLNLVIKELQEPAQRESLGIYTPPPGLAEDYGNVTAREPVSDTIGALKEEEDQPRRRKRST